MRDFISNIGNKGYEQFVGDSNTTAIDRAGFESVGFCGTISVAPSVTLKLEESADNITFNDVLDGQQYGDLGVVAVGGFKVGYTGYKRYVRLADSAAGATVDSVALLAYPSHAPIA